MDEERIAAIENAIDELAAAVTGHRFVLLQTLEAIDLIFPSVAGVEFLPILKERIEDLLRQGENIALKGEPGANFDQQLQGGLRALQLVEHAQRRLAATRAAAQRPEE